MMGDRRQLTHMFALTGDVQLIANPGWMRWG